MPQPPLRLGLAGLGRHGERYARHLLDGVPGLTLAAVCRRDIEAGGTWARAHGVAFHVAAADLAADPQVDAVAVVTPPGAHREAALAAIRCGKPVLIEKPLAATAAHAEEIARAAETAGVPCMVAHTLRREVLYALLVERVAAFPGPLYLHYLLLADAAPPARTRPGDPSIGRILEVGVHILDWIAQLRPARAWTVRCTTDAPPPGENRFRAELRAPNLAAGIDVGRNADARIEQITVEAGGTVWTGERFAHRLRRWDRNGEAVESLPDPRPTVPSVLREFGEFARRGGRSPIPARDGLRAVRLAEACAGSARDDGRPRVVEGCAS